MVVTDPPPGGGSAIAGKLESGLTRPPGINQPSSQTSALNNKVSDQSTATPIVMGGSFGDKKEMRSFAQILAEKKQKRNIFEIKIRK